MSSHIVTSIRTHCRPYLALLSEVDRPLLRGHTGFVLDVLEATVRTDRRPRNSLPRHHEVADQWFLKHFQVRYRSASLFCTSRWSDAAQFGAVVAIFPVGYFRFCWSPQIADLYQDVFHPLEADSPLPPDQEKEEIERALAGAVYQEEDFPAAIASGHEIMVYAASYYAIRLERQEEQESLCRFILGR